MVRPYISFVVPSRNDDHTPDNLARLLSFYQAISEQAKAVDLDVEVIIVDWNPPPDRYTLLDEIVEWDYLIHGCNLTVVEVPPEVHNQYSTSDRIPLFTMMAFNVGTWQAAGEFVLPAPQDLIYSNEMFERWARLEHGVLYRAFRHDIRENGFPYDAPIARRLEYCNNNVITIRLSSMPYTNACGDFILMSRDDWIAIRGWPEYDGFPIYLDGYTIFKAIASGMKVMKFDEPFYHVTHAERLRPGTGLEERNIPYIPYSKYGKMVQALRADGTRTLKNEDNWGCWGDKRVIPTRVVWR